MTLTHGDQYYEDGGAEEEDPEALEKPEFGDLDEEVGALLGKGGDEGAGNAAEDSKAFEKLRAALGATASGRLDDGGDDIDDEWDDDDDDDDDGGDADDGGGKEGEGGGANAGNKFSKRAAKRWRKARLSIHARTHPRTHATHARTPCTRASA